MGNLIEEFRTSLQSGGLSNAMRWLNDRAPYRFTAIFAFNGDLLRNICLVDKENPAVTSCPDQTVENSYCIYVRRSGEPFAVNESMLDERVRDHPKRNSFQCYYGIPLVSRQGHLLGTVCHFDPAPVRVTEEVVDTLDDLASLIAASAFPA